MNRISLYEIKKLFKEYNLKHNIVYGRSDNKVKLITAIIVYKQENFTKPYTELERSYRISNESGKVFFNMPSGSQSLVGNCLDGKDLHVRLDYLNWDIDYCYLELD